MSILDKLLGKANGPSPADTEIQVTETTSKTEAGLPSGEGHPEKHLDDAEPNPAAQIGVQEMEAVTLGWDKKWLAALLIKYVPITQRKHTYGILTSQ